MSVDGARVDFGHVPLDTEVRHVFSVRNDGAAPVSFRPATVHVVEGCCPSTPALGAASLAPGDTTTLSMAMMMHVGMAGPHHFRLSLPVVTADGSSQPLEMHLFGHFG